MTRLPANDPKAMARLKPAMFKPAATLSEVLCRCAVCNKKACKDGMIAKVKKPNTATKIFIRIGEPPSQEISNEERASIEIKAMLARRMLNLSVSLPPARLPIAAKMPNSNIYTPTMPFSSPVIWAMNGAM